MQNVGQVTGKKRVNVANQNCKNNSSVSGISSSSGTKKSSGPTSAATLGGASTTGTATQPKHSAAAPPPPPESDEESVSEVDSFPIDRTYEIESEGEDNDEESEDPEDEESEDPDEEDEDCEDPEDSEDSEDPDEEDEDAAELTGGDDVAGAGAAGGGAAGGKNFGKKFMLKCDELDIPMQSSNTKARLEALLEAADEAAQALHRMRSDSSPRDKNLLSRSLIAACTDNDVNAVRRLLGESNSTINEGTDDGESLLSLACSAGYYELAQVLLAMNAHVEDRGQKNDTTPLMEAASAGHVDIIRLLINHGADVNALSSTGNSPLMYACAAGHVDAVSELLESDAHVEDHNENGHTPLMEAASAGHVEVAKILLEHGAGINRHSNEFKESALTLACYKGHLEMVRFLLAAGADQEHKTDEMHTALMEASMDGHVEVARLLLDSGAQVNMPTDSFESPLTLAACGGHTQLALLLIERGANIEEVNDESYTPLMEAAREGHEEMVALLLARGANINAQTEETQETALTLACCGGFLDVAAYLLRNGADIELGASTPLMEAAQEGHIELVKFLLENGADVHAQTQTGDTALTYACENGHTDVAEVLLSYNAKLEHESEGGRTPLMKACRAGHICTVKFLINKGAMVNRTTTNNDHTPLSLACAGGHQAVVELLLKSGADPFLRLKDNSTMLIEASKGGHIDVVRLLLDYPSSVVQGVDMGGVLPSATANVLNTQIVMPHDQLAQQQAQQLATQQQLIAIQQQAQLVLQQQQQMLGAPPGLQDVPEAMRASITYNNQFPQVAGKDGNSNSNNSSNSSCILKNVSELLNSPGNPILSEIMQMQAGFKDGLALGLNKGQPEIVNHLINNLSNSLVQHQYQLASEQDQEKMKNLVLGKSGQRKPFGLGGTPPGGIQYPAMTMDVMEAYRSDPLGEEEGEGEVAGGTGQAAAYFQPGATTEEMQKHEKLLEYQIANYDNTQFKLICDGILPPDLYVDIQAGEEEQQMQQQQQLQVECSDAAAAAGPMMPLPVPINTANTTTVQQTTLSTASEVSQDTAISNRPKVKPVSKKDGKNANRKAQLAAAAAAAVQASATCVGAAQEEQTSGGGEVVMVPGGGEGLAMVDIGTGEQQHQQQMMISQPQQVAVGQMFDKHFHEHENYLNDLQQQMQFYRQRLEKHQQLQHQLQQHQAQQQQTQTQPQSSAPAQTIDINTVNKIMNFLTGPHANVIQQLQQQQPCSGEMCAVDPAGQDLSAIAQEQLQQSEDQILEQHQATTAEDHRVGAQGQSDDEGAEVGEDEDEEGGVMAAKEPTDADSQTQNLSSSSESDELINPQWDEKMWRTVAHRPNHPFQKKAQQVTQQRALGVEEESIDNDTIAEFLRVLCGLRTDNPISYIPALVQLQKQPGGKPQKLVANVLNDMQQLEDAQLIENQLDQLHMLGLDDSDRETIPDCEIYPHMMGELSDQVMPAEAFMMDDDDDDLEGEEEEAGRELDGESKGEPTSNKTDLDYYILGAFSALNVSNLPLPIQNDPNMTRQETADLFANIIANHAQHLEQPAGSGGGALTLQQQQLQLLASSLADATKTKTDELLDQLLINKQTLKKSKRTLQQLEQQQTACSTSYVAKQMQDLKQHHDLQALNNQKLSQVLALQQQHQQQHQNMLNMISGQMQIDLNNPNCRFGGVPGNVTPTAGVMQGQQYQQVVGLPQQQQHQMDANGTAPQAAPLSVLQPHQILPKTNHQPQPGQEVVGGGQCYQHSQATQTKGRADGQESVAGANKRSAPGGRQVPIIAHPPPPPQQQHQANHNAGDFANNHPPMIPPQQQQQFQISGSGGGVKNNGLVSVVPVQGQVPQQQPTNTTTTTTTTSSSSSSSTSKKCSGQGTVAGAAEKLSRKDKRCLGSSNTTNTNNCNNNNTNNRHQSLIDSDFDCNFDDADLFGPPFTAAHQTPNDKIIDVDSETDSNHDTALTLACAGGHDELVKLLLSRGANIEHRDKKGFTPLILAATAGHTKVVEALLQFGADMEAQSERTKDTPLSLACSGGRYDVVELLLNVGANKEHRNVSDYTPLSLAASGGYVNIIKLLLQKGAEINSRTGSKLGISPLMLAAMNGHTPAVKLLLDMGSDINAQIETNRNTALTLACFQGRHEVVSLLLDRKANVEHRAKTGLTPLMEAASGGYIDVGRVLLDKGADVNAAPVPSSRDTALTIAADKGHLKFVELLLYRGASVEVKNKKGNSPLWLAANGGHLPVVEILCSHDADIDSQDNRKVSCLMAAFRKGHTKVVKWMVNHVAQFPSDQEMTRYISTVSDKELLEKCNECVKVILAAKEAQDLKAYKNASILLEELYLEKTREESRKAAAARRREKKKKKKLEKKEEKRKMLKEDVEEEEHDMDDDEDSDRLNDEEDDSVPEMMMNVVDREEGDSGIDANSQGSCSSTELAKGKAPPVVADGKKSKAAKKKEKAAAAAAAAAVVTINARQQPVKKEDSPPPQPQQVVTTPVTPGKARPTNSVPALATTAVEQKKNEKNQKCVEGPPTKKVAVVVVNAHEKENVQPKEEPKSGKGAQSQQQQQKSGHLETGRQKEVQQGAKSSAGHPDDVSPNTLNVTTQQQANRNNVKANQKTEAKQQHQPVANSNTSPQQQNYPGQGPHLPQQQHHPMKKGDEGWKEVVRKSSVQQQQQQQPSPSSSGASGGGGNNNNGASAEHNCKKIQVPTNAISRVIGRAGSNINAIRASTGAHIEVEKQGKSQSDRLITIKGSAEATKQAHQLIATLIKDPDVDILQVLSKVCSGSGSGSGTSTPANVASAPVMSVPKPIVPTGVSVWGQPSTGPAPKIAPDLPNQQQQPQQLSRTESPLSAMKHHLQGLGSKSGYGSSMGQQQGGSGGMKGNNNAGGVGKSGSGGGAASSIVKPTPGAANSQSQMSGLRTTQVGGGHANSLNNNSNNNGSLRNGGNTANLKGAGGNMDYKYTLPGGGATTTGTGTATGPNRGVPGRPGMPMMEQGQQNRATAATTIGAGAGAKRPSPGSFAAKLQSSPGAVGGPTAAQEKNGGGSVVQLSPKHHHGYQQQHGYHHHHGQQHHSAASAVSSTNTSSSTTTAGLNSSSNLNHGGAYQSTIGAGRPQFGGGNQEQQQQQAGVIGDSRAISPIINNNLARMSSPLPMKSPNVSADMGMGGMSSALGNFGQQLQIQANSAHIYSLFNEAPKWETAATSVEPKVDVTKAPGYRVNPTISSPVSSSKAGSSQSITPPTSVANPGSERTQQQQQVTPPGTGGSGGSSSSAGGGASSTGMLGVNVGTIGSAKGASGGGGGSAGGQPMAVQRPGMRSPRYSSAAEAIGSGQQRSQGNYFDHMMEYGPLPQMPQQQQQSMQASYQQGMGGMQQQSQRRSNSFAGGAGANAAVQPNSAAPGANKPYVQPPPIGTGSGGGGGNPQQSQSMMNQFSKANHPYGNRSSMAAAPGGGGTGGGAGNNPRYRWYEFDDCPLTSGGGGSSSGVGNNSTSAMMGITNGLGGLGLTGSPSSMSPSKVQQGPQQQQQQQQQQHHVNGGGMGEEERKMMRAIGTERSWKYGGGFGVGNAAQGPIVPLPPSMGGGNQMDADPMALWMMLEKATGGVGVVGNQQQQMPMHGSWMSSNNNNNISVNKSRPPQSFMPEPDLHLQDPYSQFQMEYLGMHQQQQQQQQPYLPYQMQFPHSDVPPPAPGPMPQDKGTDHWGDPHDKHAWGASKWAN